DGKGFYSFTGSMLYNVNGATAQPYTRVGGYVLSTSGLFEMDSLINGSDAEWGGVASAGPNAFVASATEGPFWDIIVGIPVATDSSAAKLPGPFRAGYIDLLN